MSALTPQPPVDGPATIDTALQSKQRNWFLDFCKKNTVALVMVTIFVLGLLGNATAMIWKMGQYSGELTSNVVNLEEKVTEMKGEVAEVKAEVADVKAEVAEVKAEMKDVKVELGGVRDKVHRLAEDVSYIKGRLDERDGLKSPASAKLSDSSIYP